MAKAKSEAPAEVQGKKIPKRVHWVDGKGTHVDAVVLKVENKDTGALQLSTFPKGGKNATVVALPDEDKKVAGTWHEVEKE